MTTRANDLPTTPGTHGLTPMNIVILGALTAFAPMAIDMYLPAFSVIAGELSVPAEVMPRTLAVFLVGLASGQLVMGPLSDRLGRRPPLIVGSLAFAGASALCAAAHSFDQLLLARLMMGLGGSAGMIVARAIVRDRCDELTSARILSLMMLVMGLAPVLAPAGGELLLRHANWHSIFVVLAVFGLLCAAAAFALPETLPKERRHPAALREVVVRYAQMLIDQRFIGYASAAGCSSGVLFAYIAGSPFAYMTVHGVSAQRFSYYFAANAIGLFAAAQVNRRLLATRTPAQLLLAGFIVNALSGLVLAITTWRGIGGFPLFFGALFVCVATLGFIMPNSAALVMTPFGRQAGSASALLGTVQYSLGALAGAAVGFFANGTALPMAVAIALSGAGGVLLLLLNAKLGSAKLSPS